MSYELLQSRLDKLKSTILHTGFGDEASENEIVCYELLPLIKESEELNVEFERRLKLYKQLKGGKTSLNSEETAQWRSLHLEAFNSLSDPKPNSDKLLGDDARTVCDDLMLFLEMQVDRSERKGKPNTGRKAAVQYLGDNRLSYKNKEYLLPKNSIYTEICEKLYEHCRTVGSTVHPSTIFNECNRAGRRYDADPLKNWHWVSDMVYSANRYAKRHNIPKLFRCGKNAIERLGTAK